MANLDELLRAREPLLWLNDDLRSVRTSKSSELGLKDVRIAEARLKRFAPLLCRLFPELASSNGIIESALLPAPRLQATMMPGPDAGRWLIKADHALPVAGSVKARGGIYEVLVHAEDLAMRSGLLEAHADLLSLASPSAKALFGRHEIAVGSTGNLGLSIGVVAAALGFQATVHMSSDAKEWKKARLRARGVRVIQHEGDFGAAVAKGREEARSHEHAYFIDDEDSRHLFLGYSVAALRLHQQLCALGVTAGAENPLFVYLPCGVGGAPGGITFGLRHLYGDHVHCFFAEPVASPCMLVRLAYDRFMSVTEIGLDNVTEADGLAVGRASEFVAPLMRSLVSGVFTVPDKQLFEDLYRVEQTEGICIEPSAAAGFRGPQWLLQTRAGRDYLVKHDLAGKLRNATHILWTTGGLLVPSAEYQQFHERGRLALGPSGTEEKRAPR